MRHLVITIAVLVTMLPAVEASGAKRVAIEIYPNVYVVEKDRFSDRLAAVAHAVALKPAELHVRGCLAMPTKRVIDVMELVGKQYTGRVVVGSISAGTGECPNFSPQPDARPEAGAHR